MKGIKAETSATTETAPVRRPRKERVRRIQHVTAAVAAQSLKQTVELLSEEFPEVASIKRKTELMNFLCRHEEAVKVLEARLFTK